ncbi:hypothetical protein KPA07_09700 [Corynebacterium aurimucosum]|uniref:hypothetical protein n=1 Tax=Corynebacterium aurimucosum TaxID=169292 RepID=UPI001C0EC77D|nr:hypothetical protein [Corynebacterium aurimucosum]MBU5655176.1 hypothetical protein [Corynebacterium aurimucosum]
MKRVAAWAAGTHILVTVVVNVASKLIYYVVECPKLAPAFPSVFRQQQLSTT